ncbi:MAG: (deoxy)nucleoside triphosphate pyrophosphohydrolase [Faecousia sp.]
MCDPIEVVAALLWQGERFLICQRSARKARGLQWEFAGGKVEPGETKQQALMRECWEELGIAVSVGPEFMALVHSYPDITIRLTVFHASIVQGEPRKLEHNELRWVLPEEAGQFDFCPADRLILNKLQKEQSQ